MSENMKVLQLNLAFLVIIILWAGCYAPNYQNRNTLELSKKGKTDSGWLGVMIQKITPELAKSFELNHSGGALVGAVIPEGPAFKGGVKRGDVIVRFDGKAVIEMEDLPKIVAATTPNSVVNVEVVREGAPKTLRVKIEVLKDSQTTVVAKADSLGMQVQEITPEIARSLQLENNQGVLVADVTPGNSAAESGIRRGDVIAEMNRTLINNMWDYQRLLGSVKKGASVLFLVKRGGSTIYLTVKGRDDELKKMVSRKTDQIPERGKLEDAQEQVRLYPDNAGVHLILGDLYEKQGRIDEAIASFKEAVRINPNNADMQIVLGHAYTKVDQYRDAMASIKEAIRIRPNESKAYYFLGMVYEKLSKHQEAIVSYKEAIRINPDHVKAHRSIGFVYELLGRNDEAISAYKEAVRIDPNLISARNDLNALEQKMARTNSSPPVRQAAPNTSAIKIVSGGTGFLFNSKDYIVTNYHVVKGASSIEVKFPDGEVIKASVQAKDSQNDIAVLKLSKSPSTPIPDLKFGDSSKVRPGDKVFTIGYPASSILGKNQKITDGIISSVTGINDDPTMFQITVPIQPGNSGGPLFNQKGEVIGITTASLSLNAIQSLGAVPQNVNYAIKSSFVNNLLTTIPKTLLSNRGIVVVPNKPGNSLSDFFERVSNNVVLIEAK
jgi:S1-C subfamily serine protease